MGFTKSSFICLLLLAYMALFHFRRKRLPLKSTRLFNAYFILAIVVTFFDFITLTTVNMIDKIPIVVNDILHTIYLLSIDWMTYALCLYVQCLLKRDLALPKWALRLQAFPVLLTSLMIIVHPIKYIHGTYTNYSSGLKVYSLYLAIIINNVILFYTALRYNKNLDNEKRTAILATVPLFLIVSIVSFLYPEALIVILYVALSTIGLLLTGENMEKYIHKQTGMFNRYALEVVANEFISYKKHRVASIISLNETDHMDASIDRKSYINIMKALQDFCLEEFNRQVYRINDNGFVLLENAKATAHDSSDKIAAYVKENFPNYEVHCEYLSLSEYKDYDTFMSNVVNICLETMNKAANYDFLTGIRNRNSFEKIITTLRNENVDAYYFIADVNNLKETNDFFGHSAGDKLLQTVAKVLQDTVKDNGWVFRLGGDEFVILWNGDDIPAFLESLEKNKKPYMKETVLPISFAIGYGKILDPDGVEIADKMMYENKTKMKRDFALL